MIPIVDFCWRNFSLEQFQNVNIKEMYELAQTKQPDLFLLHDPGGNWSSLVIPELVIDSVEKFDLPVTELASATGLLSILQRDQLRVHENQPASLVATLAAWQQAEAIIAVDDNHFPLGLLIPNAVAEGLPERSQIQHESSKELQQAVKRLSEIGDLAGAIAAIEREHDHFHSESEMAQSRNPYVCQDHGKAHFSTSCPCTVHPNAPCTKGTVVGT